MCEERASSVFSLTLSSPASTSAVLSPSLSISFYHTFTCLHIHHTQMVIRNLLYVLALAGLVPASATLCLQTGLKSTSTRSLLQALVCGSGDLPLTAAVRSIPHHFSVDFFQKRYSPSKLQKGRRISGRSIHESRDSRTIW